MDQSTLNRVHRIVSSILPPTFDREDIAMDILVESWSKQVDEPSYGFIRHRCLDEVKLRGREHEILSSFALAPPPHMHDPTPEDHDTINYLTAVLDQPEKKVIFYRFYLDLTQSEIAKKMRLDEKIIRELLSTAIFKMKQAAY